MTNEEINKWLSNLKDDMGKAQHQELWHYAEALNIAIEALSNNQKQTDSELKTTADSVSEADVIYRRDAIDAIDEIDWHHQNSNKDMVSGANPDEHQAWYKADDVYKALDSIPSAQPEIIRCKDCKWWDKSENSLFGYCMAMKHGFISANWEIGIYRRYKGDFYCADAERRTDE